MGQQHIVDLERINDANSVKRVLHDVVAQERSIQVELEQRLLHRKDMETELLNLIATMSDVIQQANNEADGLASAVQSTASQAQQVSQRVRRLDTAQANLSATTEKIHLVMECTSCMHELQAALQAADYEAVADQIVRYQDLELGDTRIPACSPHAPQHAAIVADAREKLLHKVRQQVKESLSARDTTAAIRFLKLYKPLKQPEEGMAAATSFVSSATQKVADEQFQSLQKSAQGKAEGCDFVGTLSTTLRSVFQAVKEYKPLVDSAFGPGHAVSLIINIIKDLDNKVPRIVACFIATRGLDKIVQDASSSTGGGGALSMDPVAVDRHLTELRSMIACCQEFVAFLTKSAAAAVHPKPMPQAFAEALRIGRYAHSMQELQAAYVSLERCYLQRSIAKAVELDVVMQGAMMSSMLDDGFFVLKQACTRSLSTGSMHCFVSTLSLAVSELGGAFRDALSKKLPPCASKIIQLFVDGAVPDAASVEEAAAPLNNMVLSTVYTAKMHDSLEAQAVQRFTAASESEAVRSALDDVQQTASSLREMSMQFCENLADTLLQQLVRQPLNTLANMSFQLSDAQYSEREGEPGWARSLCNGLQHYVEHIFSGLAREAQTDLSRSLLARLLFRVEGALSSKKFTALGGLLLDRDIRTLTSGVADITGQPVRERFARLNQMVMLLTLENINEVTDLWADESMAWRLSAAEVKTTLASRVDLERASIAALQLH